MGYVEKWHHPNNPHHHTLKKNKQQPKDGQAAQKLEKLKPQPSSLKLEAQTHTE